MLTKADDEPTVLKHSTTSPRSRQKASVRMRRYYAPSVGKRRSESARRCARADAEPSATGSVERRAGRQQIQNMRALLQAASIVSLEDEQR